jgi:hypothetical protein
MAGDASNFLASGQMFEEEFANPAGGLANRSPEPQVGVSAPSQPKRCTSKTN